VKRRLRWRFIVALLALTIQLQPVDAADSKLLLEMSVNGNLTGKIGEFVQRDGALLARPQELQDLGLRVPATVPVGADGLVSLAALPGITWKLDEGAQKLSVTASDDRLLPNMLNATAAAIGPADLQTGLGAMVNYDISATSVGSQRVGSGSGALVAFSPWGNVSFGMLGFLGSSPAGPGTSSAVRLDATYTYSDPESLRRYRVGDVIVGGLSWTRPVRVGGAQITGDFSMRPDLITFPLPSVSGSVAVPSAVDVLVNGAQLFSREVQPGPFEIPQLPVVTGAGTIAMTMTNALGRQVTSTVPFYASSSMLAPGLQTYSAEIGKVRQNWASSATTTPASSPQRRIAVAYPRY